jgi:molecular chaperone HtpG
LKGVIDCPDLPLNVSRSALQNDGFVKKISDYISKKVADKLSGMCKIDRASYEKYWDDISPFIKFGCLKDEKFCEKMTDYILFKDLNSKYLTLSDYVESNSAKTENVDVIDNADITDEKATDTEEEKSKNTVYYVTDEQQQSQYINMFKEEGLNAVILTHNIDSPFVTQLEQKNEEIKFQRIDADLTDTFKEETDIESMKADTDTLTDVFRKALNNEKLDVKVEKLKNETISSMITLSEESRRMQDMMKTYNMYGMDPSMFGSSETLVLNANNTLVKYIIENKDSQNIPMLCEQLYDLALICHKPLAGDAMTKFITRSNAIMLLLAN